MKSLHINKLLSNKLKHILQYENGQILFKKLFY